MSRLAAALRALVEPPTMTIEVMMDATGAKKTTAAKLKNDVLAIPAKMTRWDGHYLESFSQWERDSHGTTTIADALAGRESDSEPLDDVRKVRAVLHAAGTMTTEVADALDDQRISTKEWMRLDAVGEKLQAATTALRRVARRNLRRAP
jgi:hypothetical protein